MDLRYKNFTPEQEQEIVDSYVISQNTQEVIAHVFCSSIKTIRQVLLKHHVAIRPPMQLKRNNSLLGSHKKPTGERKCILCLCVFSVTPGRSEYVCLKCQQKETGVCEDCRKPCAGVVCRECLVVRGQEC